jgi:Immunoglobulin-like domain of bacterial spore germination/Sporulation and spore germination
MTTPMPTDEEISEELAAVLRSEAERVTPEPALQQILTRAHQAGPTKSTRRRGGWLPVIGGAAATAGLAAAAIVIFAPEEQRSTTDPAVSCAVEVRQGCPVELAVWYHSPGGDQLISGGFTVRSTGNVGVDAVEALLNGRIPRFGNPWSGLGSGQPQPIAEVNDVTHADNVVTVDFDGPLSASASMEGDGGSFGELTLQQLVLTVQSALRTDDPVQITIEGTPATEAFGVPLSGPLQADWSLVSGIRPESPEQGSTVANPVTVTGQSSTLEATIQWSVERDGRVVDENFDTGGGLGEYFPYRFRLNLPPGDYTLKLWEENLASGAEAWTAELAVVYIDFTVE